MTVGSRNGAKLTERRVGVCVLCERNITLTDKWSRIRQPKVGPVHNDCIVEE